MDIEHGQIYRAAAHMAAQWIVENMDTRGSLRQASTLSAYYKVPLSLAEAGCREEANLALNWIINNYARGDGYYQDSASLAMSRKADLYETLWIAWGAAALERTDVTDGALALILRYLDLADGGFYSSIASDYRAQGKDLRSTALGGLVSAVTGRMDAAVAAAEFVISLLNSQPQLESRRFFLVRGTSSKIVTRFHSESERYFVITPHQSRPLYYALGLAVAFLAKLASMTGNLRYLDAAQGYVDVCISYGEGLLRHDYSGKLAWGLALLYRQTGRKFLESHLIHICDYLCTLRQESGEWRATFVPSTEATGLGIENISYDRTAEYSLWLTYIMRESEQASA